MCKCGNSEWGTKSLAATLDPFGAQHFSLSLTTSSSTTGRRRGQAGVAARHPVPPPAPLRRSTSTSSTTPQHLHPRYRNPSIHRHHHIQPPSPRAPYQTRGRGCMVPCASLTSLSLVAAPPSCFVLLLLFFPLPSSTAAAPFFPQTLLLHLPSSPCPYYYC